MFTARVCRKCDQRRPLADYPINLTLSNGHVLYKHTCNQCRAKQSKDRTRLHRRHAKPGAGACPICQRYTLAWVLDHDHETGQFRGWLCNDCNNGLGKFNDDPNVLRRGLAYLTRNDEPPVEVKDALRAMIETLTNPPGASEGPHSERASCGQARLP